MSGWIADNDSPFDDYEQHIGTSLASPQVAGAIALLYLDPSLDEGFKATDIENTLYDNALDMGAKGKDKYYGHGMVNLKYFEIAGENNDEALKIADELLKEYEEDYRRMASEDEDKTD